MCKTLYYELAVLLCFHFPVIFSQIQSIISELSLGKLGNFLPSLSLLAMSYCDGR